MYRTPSNKTMIASSVDTLFDLMKSDAIRGMYIHCSFPYAEVRELLHSIIRRLYKVGVVSVDFAGEYINVSDAMEEMNRNPKSQNLGTVRYERGRLVNIDTPTLRYEVSG